MQYLYPVYPPPNTREAGQCWDQLKTFEPISGVHVGINTIIFVLLYHCEFHLRLGVETSDLIPCLLAWMWVSKRASSFMCECKSAYN